MKDFRTCLIAEEILKCKECGNHSVIVFESKTAGTINSRCLYCDSFVKGEEISGNMVDCFKNFISKYKKA